MKQFLDEVQLEKIAPSIFATGGASTTSDRYGFIPTIACVKGLKEAGFYPVKANQSKTRIDEKKSYVKHMIRFRHVDQQMVNGNFPEIVLVNSHDGSTSYQLRAGIYRLVCTNGLIVGTDTFCRRIKHQGDVVEKVVNAANDLVQVFPESIEIAAEWEKTLLTHDQKEIFAEAAASLKWEEDKLAIDPKSLLRARRNADVKNDVWTTFNVVQENLIQGGLRYRTESGQRQRTRGVNSVGENTRLNTALWTLTDKLSKLVK